MNTRKRKVENTRKQATRVPNETFVMAWARSKTNADVMKSTGLTYSGMLQKAKKLRELGVKLPKLDRPKFRHAPVDVAALNALLR